MPHQTLAAFDNPDNQSQNVIFTDKALSILGRCCAEGILKRRVGGKDSELTKPGVFSCTTSLEFKNMDVRNNITKRFLFNFKH